MPQLQYDSNGIPTGLLEEDPAQQAAQTRQSSRESWAASLLDPSSPGYVGPGYADTGAVGADGQPVLTLVDAQANGQYKLTHGAGSVPSNPNGSTADLVADAEAMAGTGATAAPKPTTQRSAVTPAFSGVGATPATTPRAAPTSPGVQIQGTQANVDALKRAETQATGVGDANPYTAPGAEAPKVDRAAVDKALAPVNQIGGMLTAEALQNKSAGLAEAQLARSTAEAQSHALGQARAGNRRDRAMLERQAIGEGAYLEQEGGRQAAELRAKEELQNRQFKVDTLGKAAELGLNTAAYEIDIAKADLGSAQNWIDNEFQQLGLDKQLGVQKLQLDETKMRDILGFTRDMAAIQYQYDALSVQDQNEADALMIQKYGIDKETAVALKKIKEDHKFRWGDLLTNMAGGLVSGGLGMLGRGLIPEAK